MLRCEAKRLKSYLLSEFQANLKTHCDCATHCASLGHSDNTPCGNVDQHQESCPSCLEIFHFIRELKECTDYLQDTQIAKEVEKIEGNLNNYTGHIVRGKYQIEHFMTDINNLRPGKAVMVAHYMMKLLF